MYVCMCMCRDYQLGQSTEVTETRVWFCMVVLRCGSALILLETKDSVTASVFRFWQRYVCRTGWTHGWFATSEAFLLPPREESRRPHTGIYVRCSKNSFHLLSRTLGVTSLPPREESCRPHTDIYVRCSKNNFRLLSRTLGITSPPSGKNRTDHTQTSTPDVLKAVFNCFLEHFVLFPYLGG